MEPAVALKGGPFFQLIGNKSLGFRNQFQQRQVEIPVLDHIEVSPRTHGSPVNFDVSDAAVRKESPDILAEEKHGGIGQGIFVVAFHDELTGTEHLFVCLMYGPDLLLVGI